jgi:glycosyltransferase involved in cell wall biosynthesis
MTDRPSRPTAVTAVMPVHNGGATIGRALASVAAQTAPVARVIVVDDASSDDSVAVAAAAGLTNLEVVPLSSNVGPGAARNTGVAHASTEWVAFLDADDVWEPGFVAEVSAAISQFDADYASAGGLRMRAYRDKRTTSRRLLNRSAVAFDLTDDFWRVALRLMPIHLSATIVRRSLFEEVGGFPEDVRNGEDVTLYTALWLNGRFAFVNKPLYESVAISGGLSASPRDYYDVRMGVLRMFRALGTAIKKRRRGTAWFAIWVLERAVQRHVWWLVRRLRLGERRDRWRRTSEGGDNAAA